MPDVKPKRNQAMPGAGIFAFRPGQNSAFSIRVKIPPLVPDKSRKI